MVLYTRTLKWVVIFPPPVDHSLAECLTMTQPSRVALHFMAHNFIELCKPIYHSNTVIHEVEGHIQTENDVMEEGIPCKWKYKKDRVVVIISERIDFKSVIRDKEGHCIMTRGRVQEEDIKIVIIYAPDLEALRYIRQMPFLLHK